jgi:hypothetical protein
MEVHSIVGVGIFSVIGVATLSKCIYTSPGRSQEAFALNTDKVVLRSKQMQGNQNT